mgnify:CR=1 FL=1
MKLKCSFENVDMGDEIIAVPIGNQAESIHGVIKMNKEGQIIFDLLKKDMSESQIVDTLCGMFDNNREVIEKYVHSVVNQLIQERIIE